MKVLHVITGLNDGGAEAVLHRLVSGDCADTHRVISLMGPGKYGPLLEAAGVEVDYLGMSRGTITLLAFLRLWRLVSRVRPDVVQTWMYHADLLGGLAAWLAGRRQIIWGLHHTTLDPSSTSRAVRLIVALNARLARFVPRRIISCSEKGIAVHEGAGYPAQKLVVVHNGFDVNVFKPDPVARNRIRADFGVPKGALLLGCVARFDPQKDHGNLLAAFEILSEVRPDARLLLVGTGVNSRNAQLGQLIAQTAHSDRITLAGQRSDVPAIMNGIDIHVLPSAFGEAFPNVLNEAMASGTPCVATDVGDSALILGPTGESCPPSDPKALARAILRMAKRLESQPDLARACRERIVDSFSLESMVAGYRNIWSEACGR